MGFDSSFDAFKQEIMSQSWIDENCDGCAYKLYPHCLKCKNSNKDI